MPKNPLEALLKPAPAAKKFGANDILARNEASIIKHSYGGDVAAYRKSKAASVRASRKSTQEKRALKAHAQRAALKVADHYGVPIKDVKMFESSRKAQSQEAATMAAKTNKKIASAASEQRRILATYGPDHPSVKKLVNVRMSAHGSVMNVKMSAAEASRITAPTPNNSQIVAQENKLGKRFKDMSSKERAGALGEHPTEGQHQRNLQKNAKIGTVPVRISAHGDTRVERHTPEVAAYLKAPANALSKSDVAAHEEKVGKKFKDMSLEERAGALKQRGGGGGGGGMRGGGGGGGGGQKREPKGTPGGGRFAKK